MRIQALRSPLRLILKLDCWYMPICHHWYARVVSILAFALQKGNFISFIKRIESTNLRTELGGSRRLRRLQTTLDVYSMGYVGFYLIF
jgi:hypothetical protein